MRAIAVLMLVAVGGCAMSPLQVVEQGKRFDFSSNTAPAVTAGCIARSAEEYVPGFVPGILSANVRAAAQPGVLEVVVRAGEAGTMALARVTPSATGSSVTIWVTPNAFAPDSYFAGVSKGC